MGRSRGRLARGFFALGFLDEALRFGRGKGSPPRVWRSGVGTGRRLLHVVPCASMRPMAASLPEVSKKPTYADIEALPEHLRGEILAGELVVSPRPAPPHARVGSRLGALLNMRFDMGVGGPGGWYIVGEPELSLAADPDYDPVIPDIAGWRQETMPEEPVTAQYKTTPDWVCEILSPSTGLRDRTLKRPYYGRAGVQHLWLVDPVQETLEVFRLEDDGWKVVLDAGGDQTVRAEPFDAVELDLALLWRK